MQLASVPGIYEAGGRIASKHILQEETPRSVYGVSALAAEVLSIPGLFREVKARLTPASPIKPRLTGDGLIPKR